MRSIVKKLLHKGIYVAEVMSSFYLPQSLRAKTKLEILFGRYETETSSYIRTHVKGGIAVDVGAHVGYFSRLLANRADHVYAFEPDPINYQLLVKNTKSFRNITPVQSALSDITGTASFYIVPDSTFRHSLRAEEGSIESVVAVITLDEFMKKNPGVISFVKIDVEGLEEKVLTGMNEVRERDNPLIIAEMPINDRYTPISPAIGRHGLVRNYLVV